MHRREFLRRSLALPIAQACSPVRFSTTSPPAGARLGASTACLAGYSLLESVREIRRLGFSTIEIIAYTGARHSVGEIPGFDLREASEREREQVYDATRPFRHISAHMPFQDVQLLVRDAQARRTAIERVKQAMDGLAFLGGEMAVVHAGWPEQGVTYREIWRPMLDTFRELGDHAAERDMRIGLETMQPASVEEYARLVFEIDHPAVGATIDTGHIRGATDIGLPPERRDSPEGRQRFNDVLARVFDEVAEKVLHVHLSDVSGTDWRDHRALGTGIVDFPRVFGKLDEIGYEGLLVLELEEQDQVNALASSRELAHRLMGS